MGTPATDLSLPASSRRIRRGLAWLDARAPVLGLGPGWMPTFQAKIAPLARPLGQAQTDPAHMMILQATEATVELGRGPDVDAALAVVTPQFFLRNTTRHERAPEDLEWLPFERDERPPPIHNEALELARVGGPRLQHCPAADQPSFQTLVAERRRVVIHSRWTDEFGEPDPVLSSGQEQPILETTPRTGPPK